MFSYDFVNFSAIGTLDLETVQIAFSFFVAFSLGYICGK